MEKGFLIFAGCTTVLVLTVYARHIYLSIREYLRYSAKRRQTIWDHVGPSVETVGEPGWSDSYEEEVEKAAVAAVEKELSCPEPAEPEEEEKEKKIITPGEDLWIEAPFIGRKDLKIQLVLDAQGRETNNIDDSRTIYASSEKDGLYMVNCATGEWRRLTVH